MRPQDDLYRSVNGPWLAANEIPADKAIYGAFHALWDTAEQDVRAIVEKTVAAGHPEGSEPRKIADLFTSFMDSETIERLGAEPIAGQLALADGVTDVAELVEVLGKLELEGVAGVFRVWVDADAKQSDQHIVYLMQGGLSLPDESYYREDGFAETRTAFVAHVTRMLELAGPIRPGPPSGSWSWRRGWPRTTGTGSRIATSPRPTTSSTGRGSRSSPPGSTGPGGWPVPASRRARSSRLSCASRSS
ncbi:hypothetical protein GCM10029976_045890 [Kribbella albertanoniae]